MEGFEIVYNHLPELTAEIEKLASEAVRKAAEDIHALASATLQPGYGFITGFLKSSIYMVSKGETTYGQDIEGDGELLPPIDAPTDTTTAYVAVGAEYGVFVEFGTSKMAARPYLLPAADAVRPAFIEAMTRLEDALKLGGVL